MTTAFERAFKPDSLRALAWGHSFERGSDYAADGRVKRLEVGAASATATVRGTRSYRVRLWLEDGAPMFSCTCPVAADGLFCKHCVAVGLVAFEGVAGAAGIHRRPAADDVRAYLEGLDKARVVELLVAQADDDELLRGRLQVEAARAAGATVDLARFRRAIRQAINPRGFVDYRSMYDYARGVDALIDSLADLLAAGSPAEVVNLCEYALTCLEDALGNVDDSDGQLTDIKERLCDLHHDACLAARPDPAALAERLFEWELSSDWGTFFGAAKTYADVLGDAGLAVYRQQAGEVWARTAALAPGEEREYSTRRFAITHIMETLAELSQDVDALVAIKAHDLSSPYDFVEIAEIYREAGRSDDALAWAERGAAAYPDCTDVRLLEILADEYERRGRGEDAVQVMWSLLERRPSVDSYQRLKARAVRHGDWTVRRAKALDCLRVAAGAPRITPRLDRLPRSAAKLSLMSGSTPFAAPWSEGRSEVVRALLWEGDVDAAWQEAVAGGCSLSVSMKLAGARAVEHPEDALPIFERQVDRLIHQKNRRGYEEAVKLLTTIAELMNRAGRADEFPEYLVQVRTANKQKRSLLKLLDAADWRIEAGRAARSAATDVPEEETRDAT